MGTQIIFKLTGNRNEYDLIFTPNCQVDIPNKKGIVYLDNNQRHPIGHYDNLRKDGEVVVADISLFKNVESMEKRFEYSIEGSVLKKNENNECESVKVTGVAASMNTED